MEHIKNCFAKYATFQGRARRAEFFHLVGFYYAVVIALFLVMFAVKNLTGSETLIFILLAALCIFALIMFLPMFSASVRRLHDTNKSGWCVLVPMIPFVGGFIFLFFLLSEGNKGENRFGPDPKA